MANAIKTRNPLGALRDRPAKVTPALLLLPSCVSLLLCLPAAATAAPAPLSPSDFAVSSLCSAPSPGHASCLGVRLVAKDPQSLPNTRALHGARGSAPGSPTQDTEFKKPIKGSLTPANLQAAYGLSGITPPSPQTIGIVDAYDNATAEADLEVFDNQYGLPACTEANGCFRKVNQLGNPAPLPASSGEAERGWAQEIATDIEVAHGICPSCRILLVEAKSNSNIDLYTAEKTAADLGANEISNSWGGEEPFVDNTAFNHPGIVITASSGDSGFLNWLEEGGPSFAEYPATSPHVVAVGGTRLMLNPSTKAWEGETVWNDGGATGGVLEGAGAGGGGCSVPFTAPSWQQSVADWASVGCGSDRAVADVSADADPYTGVAVYDSTENPEGDKGWGVIGGTSVASPIIASVFALAGGSQGVSYPARTLYESLTKAPGSLHDVTVGSNGECLNTFHEKTGASGCTAGEEAETCEVRAICLAGPGYDGPSGVGTPNGIGAFQPLGLPIGEGPPTAGPPSAGEPFPAPKGTSSPGRSAGAATLSALSLTRGAIVALNRRRPRISKVAFSFTLSVATRLRVTVAKRVRVHGRARWKSLSKPVTMLVGSGRQSRHLSGHGALSPGRYELTLTPEHGSPRSIVFQIG
jgi:hypothetical protein